MIRLPKKVEYALLSMQYMAMRPSEFATAKAISEDLNISFEFLAKTLQMLMKYGLIDSRQGIKGGYSLAKSPDDISIAMVIHALGQKPQIVDCIDEHDGDCHRWEDCTIKHPMMTLQKKIDNILETTTIAELTQTQLIQLAN